MTNPSNVLYFLRSITRSNKSEEIPYHCNFCKERLVNAELNRIESLWLLVLFRQFQCPHCFSSCRRPLAWIGRLWPFDLSVTESRPGVLPVRDGDINGPVTQNFLRFARWCEQAIATAFTFVARSLWTVISYIPKNLPPGSNFRPSGKFLKSSEYDSHRRSRRDSRSNRKRTSRDQKD